MMDQTIRGIQRVCAAGLDSVALRRAIVQRVGHHLPYDGYAFSTCDPDTGLMAHTIAEGIPRALGRFYVERLYPNECAAVTMDMGRRGDAIVSMLDSSPEARDAFSAHGIHSQLHVTLSVDQRLWGTWCLMRARATPPYTDRSRALLERVAPYIARGLKAAAYVDTARATTADTDLATSPGVVILDDRDQPVLRTALAMRWLADLADEGLTGPDDLPLSVLGVAARVRRSRTDVVQEVLLRVRGVSGRWYALRGSLSEPDATGRSSIVIVVRPAVRREIAPMLARLYALSERERQVVAAIVRGEPTKCIAASLGVSPHTVEEHLERACRKIGVRGRKALVAKLFVDGYAPTTTGERASALTA